MSQSLKLGELLNGTEERDAIHVAVLPVIALGEIQPGERVGVSLRYDGEYTVDPDGSTFAVGIVDPFLKRAVKRGDRCLVLMNPGTTTVPRHHWICPSIPEPEPAEEVSGWSDAECAPGCG